MADVTTHGVLSALARKKAAGASPTYLLNTDFEDTGTPAGWTTNAGSPDYDYTTTVIDGSQSLLMWAATPNVTAGFTAADEHWGYFRFRASSFGNTPYLFYSGSGNSWRMRLITTGKLRLYDGGTEKATGGTTLTIDTVYNFWWRNKKGTGSNAEFQCWISATTTKPGSSEINNSTGSQTGQTSGMVLDVGVSSTGIIYDSFIVDDEVIGDNPAGI